MSFAFADGPLFFPVTAYAEDGTVDHELTRAHIEAGVAAGPGGVFPACGTGEFHALSAGESVAVARTAVEAVAGRVPVIAGVGGPIGQAIESARNLQAAGVDGLLLLPPYLVGATQAGLEAYVAAVAAASELPVIVYHRSTAKFEAATFARLLEAQPTVVGFKDGIGDVALAQQIVLAARAVRDDVQFFNGLLTAEASQAAYRAIGIPLYSSAVFAMAPDIARAFYTAYRGGDDARCDELLERVLLPPGRTARHHPRLCRRADQGRRAARGAPGGGVRPPLVDPGDAHTARLEELLAAGRMLTAAAGTPASKDTRSHPREHARPVMSRIARIDVRRVSARMPRPWVPEAPDLHLVVVRVEDDEGAVGTGFSWTPTIGASAVSALLGDDIRRFALGQAADPTTLWPRLWGHLHEAGGGGITTIAMAGLDLALWDLRTRREGAGLATALGRRRERLPVYGSGVNLHYSAEELVAQVGRWTDRVSTPSRSRSANPTSPRTSSGSPPCARSSARTGG